MAEGITNEKQARTYTVSQRQARYGATASLYTIIVIAGLVIINWLANRYNKTVDVTSNKQYTLSQETQRVVKNLKQDATITYIDKAEGFNTAKPMLERYSNISPKVHIQYIDYRKQPTVARAYGLRYPGTAYVEMGQRREEAKAVTEEGLTGAFLKDLKGVRKVCVVSGSQEHSLDGTDSNGLSLFKTLVERDNYQTQSIALVSQTAVPSDCNVLVVAGPQTDYTANEVTAIKTYVENGGRAFFLLDPPLDFAKEHTAPNEELNKLLEGWGVTPVADLILERNPVSQIVGTGPEIPLVSSYDSHPIVNDLKNSFTGFPIARSLEIKNTDKVTNQKLFSTSDSAIATTKLNTDGISLNDPNNKKGPFALGVAGSYNTGKASNPGRFVVIGSSGFLDNGMIGFQSNRDLALNAINWLSSDEDLISIRPKQAEDRRLNMTQRQMNTFAYFDLIGIPLLIIVAGVSIFLKRR